MEPHAKPDWTHWNHYICLCPEDLVLGDRAVGLPPRRHEAATPPRLIRLPGLGLDRPGLDSLQQIYLGDATLRQNNCPYMQKIAWGY
jgi:hypothetical protein